MASYSSGEGNEKRWARSISAGHAARPNSKNVVEGHRRARAVAPQVKVTAEEASLPEFELQTHVKMEGETRFHKVSLTSENVHPHLHITPLKQSQQQNL